MKRNSDEDLRRLERLAATGDEAAGARYASELVSLGRTPISGELLKALLSTWLESVEEDHGVRFWLPDEWKKKGEEFANDAGLVMTSEGGWNYVLDGYTRAPELVREWNRLIESAGWTSSSETNWCWSFYPATRKNPRRNSDEDLRRLAREAGEGDLLAAERLAAALKRKGEELKVWVLTVVYDLDFVAFRSRDTMAESFVFASMDGVYAKMGIIIGRVIRYLPDEERDPIQDLLNAEDYAAAAELYQETAFQPTTFWWGEKTVGD
jgi:hypothetical protein